MTPPFPFDAMLIFVRTKIATVELAEKLISAARESGVRRFVQVSALGAGEGSSHYQASKGEAEERIRAAQDLDWTIFRPSVIFGAGDSFFNRFAALLAFAPVLPLACPDARLQPVWADDVAAAIERVLEDEATYGKTYPLVGPREYTLRELVRFTAETAGLKRRIVGLPDALARLQAAFLEVLPVPPLTRDQVTLLRRLRFLPEQESQTATDLRNAVFLTINGIAVGLKNTG